MRRKTFIFLIAGAILLSGFSGIAALLGTASPAAEAGANMQLDQAGKSPIAIAGGRVVKATPPPPRMDGNSWGG